MATESLNKLVIIGGGSGFIGNHLRKALIDEGYTVKIISRANKDSHPSVITWDEVKANGLPKCSAVIGLQGQNIMDFSRRWSEEFRKELWDSRVHTTALLRKVIDDTQCTGTFISTSAIGIYPPDPSATYTEKIVPDRAPQNQSANSDDNFLVDLCKEWEKVATLSPTKSASDPDKVKTTIIRNGVVLGRTGGIIKSMYLPFWLGLGSRTGSGTQWFPWIHISDLTRIYVGAMKTSQAPSSLSSAAAATIFNGVAPEPCTNAQFVRALASALHRPALGLSPPQFLLRYLLGSVRASMLLEGQKVLPEATIDKLKYQYLYPNIESACVALVQNPSL